MKTTIEKISIEIKQLEEKTKKNAGMIDKTKLEELLNSSLKEEKEQIVAAWADGYQKGMTTTKGSSEEYFRKTFTKKE